MTQGFMLRRHAPGELPPLAPDWHQGRDARSASRDLEQGAKLFQIPEHARVAAEMAIALGEPLLVTGEPGTGKTQLGYYLAWALHVGKPLLFQVQSSSVGRDLRYRFDDVAYFHAASTEKAQPDKQRFLRPGVLWQALELARELRRPPVVLIDEIDKASRDFPNDLLRDLDQFRWEVPELSIQDMGLEPEERDLRPVVVITSNLERELPIPFVRRCLYLHLPFEREIVQQALFARRDELGAPSDAFLELAVSRFMEIRSQAERKRPSTSEAIMWVRALRLAGVTEEQLQGILKSTPYLELLVKNLDDRAALLGAT
jgi:MoxR-like ATPase